MEYSFLKSVLTDKVITHQTINVVNNILKKDYGLLLQTEKIDDGIYMTRVNTLNANLTEEDHYQKNNINDVDFDTIYEIDDDNFEKEYNKACLKQGIFHKTRSESFKDTLTHVVEQLEILEDKLMLRPYQNITSIQKLIDVLHDYGFDLLENFKNLDIFYETHVDFSNSWMLDELIEHISNTYGVDINLQYYNNTPLYHERFLMYWCFVTDKNEKYDFSELNVNNTKYIISDDTIVCFNSYFKHYNMNVLSGALFFNNPFVAKLETITKTLKIIGKYEKERQ